MDGDDVVVEQEPTPEQDAAADAEFEAAFNKVSSVRAGTEGTSKDDATGSPLADKVDEQDSTKDAEAQAASEADAEAQAQADAQAAVEAEANAPATVTKAELDALRAVAGQVTALQEELRRSHDKTAGTIGSLRQTLDAVKAQAQQGIKPTLKQLTRLEGEFPELAALLKQDLEDAFGAGNATAAEPAVEEPVVDDKASGADAPGAEVDVDPFADPRVQQTLRDKEMAIVDALHPDWKSLKATPEFKEWRTSLPAAAQQLLASTWDSKVMSDAFTNFKAWNQKRVAAADANKQRGKRLERAIPATTGEPTGATAVDDDAAFMAGFNKARSGR